ncbi:hypothetical protein ASG87_08920 [Frateuria sp. Soil773]|uniref:helix-turn-helix domain-containing protein n=1 Tax=Frateuria sp. Soil773 TaxID=1736407 RepID=UPI0006F8A77D|nr:helix-turn-helix domain-containing protein [Frateuria sp. Soil773]KRE88691.1 hypothetical protein ASG87_08920 [Frateuria sp. Soil773]
MRIVHRLPAPPLRAVVDRYWSWEGAETPRLLPLMPGPGGLEVFFHYGAPFARRRDDRVQALPRAHFACVRTHPVELLAQGGPGFVAVRMKTGMGGCLTGLPVAAFADGFADAGDAWGEAARQLPERLAGTATMDERAALLDRFLLARLRAPGMETALAPALAALLHGQTRVAEAARIAGCGVRQLEKRCHAATGLAPARLRRLARLRRSLRALLLAPPGAALTASIDPAYHDQAQQVREFRELTGFAPGELRRAAAGRSHFYNPPWPG